MTSGRIGPLARMLAEPAFPATPRPVDPTDRIRDRIYQRHNAREAAWRARQGVRP